MNKEIKSTISIVVISLFAFLFTYTAISKFVNHQLFVVTILQSPVLHRYAGIISWSVPSIELTTAALLLFTHTRRMGMYLSFFLMLAFSVYAFYLLLSVSDLPCSCGGVLQSLNWKQHFFFNLLMLFIALFEILLNKTPTYERPVMIN